MTIELAAGTWGVLMSLAPLLQVYRMRQRRSSSDISLAFLTILETGFVLYLAYGLSIHNAVLIITNSVSVGTNSAALAIAIALRHSRQPSSDDAWKVD